VVYASAERTGTLPLFTILLYVLCGTDTYSACN
jgi:hypothetical protein